MKMIAAPATDIPIYINSCWLSFRVGVVPTLVVVSESSCLYSSVTFVRVVPAPVVIVVLLIVVKMRHSKTKRGINPKLHDFMFQCILCLSSFF